MRLACRAAAAGGPDAAVEQLAAGDPHLLNFALAGALGAGREAAARALGRPGADSDGSFRCSGSKKCPRAA
jgi:hypothetical protein